MYHKTYPKHHCTCYSILWILTLTLIPFEKKDSPSSSPEHALCRYSYNSVCIRGWLTVFSCFLLLQVDAGKTQWPVKHEKEKRDIFLFFISTRISRRYQIKSGEYKLTLSFSIYEKLEIISFNLGIFLSLLRAKSDSYMKM